MERLGTVVEKTIETSRKLVSITSSLPAIKTDVPPAAECEWCVDIARRVFSPWIPEVGPRELRRHLTGIERGLLDARANALRASLVPYSPEERRKVQGMLAAMLGGFRNAKQRGEGAETMVEVTAAVLRDFPVWVIAETCIRIAQNKAGLDARFPPNDSEIHTVCERILLPYRRQLGEAEALLKAAVEKPKPVWEGPKRLVDLFNKWEPPGGRRR